MRLLAIFGILLTGLAGGQTALAQFVILHDFDDSEIAFPQSTLIELRPGAFIGSYIGGLFRITSGGAFAATEFVSPYDVGGWGALVPASNGFLYGVRGDSYSHSVIYRTSPDGSQDTIVNSSLNSVGPLMEAADGNIWSIQGTSDLGFTIFKMSLDGTVTMVGAGPNNQTAGPLLQATDGNFYGATVSYTADGAGQIFRFTPAGEYTSMYTFPAGESSIGGLLQAHNGLLYGTAMYYSAVCPNLVGEVFFISLSGQFTSLRQFGGCYPSGIPFGPWAGLLEASDGNLYGTSVGGGALGYGNIFRLNPADNAITSLFYFDFSDGADPQTGGPAFVQASDGNLYGTAASGGPGQGGVIYEYELGLTPPLPTLKLFRPEAAAVGTTIRLNGNHLLGLSAVSFNGTPAQFKALNVNYADAVVPANATSGPITVTTPNGSFTTASGFTVE